MNSNRLFLAILLIVSGLFLFSCMTTPQENIKQLWLNMDEGAEYQSGEEMDISWGYEGEIDDISISLYHNEKMETMLVDSVSADEENHTWVVADNLMVGMTYTIMIVDKSDFSITDKADFKLVGKETSGPVDENNTSDDINVYMPGEGNIWESNTQKRISWTVRNLAFIDTVQVELYKGGKYFTTIVDSTDAYEDSNGGYTLGGGNGGIGSYSIGEYFWDVPASIPAGDDYQIVVRDYDNLDDYDVTNGYFRIVDFGTKTITLYSPTEYEMYIAGDEYYIGWFLTGNINKVDIDLYKGDQFHSHIAQDIDAVYDSYPNINYKRGYYYWVIDPTLQEASDYKVVITDVSDSTITDESVEFEILDADTKIITLSQPNSDITYTKGQFLNIAWSFIGEIGYVKVKLLKDGNLYYTIRSSISAGVYSFDGQDFDTNGTFGFIGWRIPPTIQAGSGYTVKVTYTLDSKIYDESDESFSIIEDNYD